MIKTKQEIIDKIQDIKHKYKGIPDDEIMELLEREGYIDKEEYILEGENND